MSRLQRWLRGSGRGPAAETETPLDLCAECGEGFVYPVSWTESGPADWFLHLRCGACGAARDVVASNYAVEVFDRQLDGEIEMIEAAAARLARESLLAEAEALGTALRLDLLSADDFR
jgi:hypothetical protein